MKQRTKAMTKKTKVKRVPKRGQYDKQTIHDILDESFICHVGFVHDGYPVVIPTAYGRKDNFIYLHGSTASRMMKNLSHGLEVCVTVTKVTGLVLAKSAFHHSMNYASVVVFGRASLVESDEEKMLGLKSFTDHVLPGRWDEARIPNKKELKGTMVLKLPIDEASAKIRTGPPVDDKADQQLPIWSGVLPIQQVYGHPECSEPNLHDSIPSSILGLIS